VLHFFKNAMPTLKHRVNLSVPVELDHALHLLARRDELSVSSKALELLRRAIEIEEDDVLLAITEHRDKKNVTFVSHEKAWK